MRPRASAAEWAKRVERWRESGLSAEQFAGESGLAAATLRVWASKLSRVALGDVVPKASPSSPFVEIRTGSTEARFELELGNGRRLRVPDGFDPKALERLLGVLDRG